MTVDLMRKYLDILAEQQPDSGFVAALDQAAQKGEINKDYYDSQSAEQQAQLLRNVTAYKQSNPNYDSGSQNAVHRAATLQSMVDQGKMTRDQAAKNAGSGDFFKGKAPVAATQTTAQASPQPKVEPMASPIDWNKQAGVKDIADTGLGRLSGGVSLSGAAGDYLNPSLRAELGNDSGGKFVADLGQQAQQLAWQQQYGDTTAQLAVNRNAQGGMSAGVGAERKLSKDWALRGGVSTPVDGRGDTRFDVGLRGRF